MIPSRLIAAVRFAERGELDHEVTLGEQQRGIALNGACDVEDLARRAMQMRPTRDVCLL
jgi:hypothetical protein